MSLLSTTWRERIFQDVLPMLKVLDFRNIPMSLAVKLLSSVTVMWRTESLLLGGYKRIADALSEEWDQQGTVEIARSEITFITIINYRFFI